VVAGLRLSPHKEKDQLSIVAAGLHHSPYAISLFIKEKPHFYMVLVELETKDQK